MAQSTDLNGAVVPATTPPLYAVADVIVDGKPTAKLSANFHEGQMKAWDCKRRFVAIIAGTQSGKTGFTPAWLWREIKKCGPGDYGYISPTFQLMELKALPEFKKFFVELLQLGTYVGSPVRRFVVSPAGEERLFQSRQTEKTVVYFGYAENPDSLESATYKAVVADEAGQKMFRQSSYEALLRRLAIHQGRMLIATTPYGAFGWLKTQIVDRFKAGDDDVEVINFSSIMNPAFPKEEFERARRTMPAWRFKLFYMGLLTKPAGIIYDCYDEPEGTHQVRRFAIPAHWTRFVGIDFGPVNTAAVLVAAETDDKGNHSGRFFVYGSYHPQLKRTPDEHVAALRLKDMMLGQAVGGSKSEGEWRLSFSQAGMPIQEPPIKEVEVGIDRVYALLKERRLLVFDDLADLIEEFHTYSRELDPAGDPTEKIENKETFHLLDATRYICSRLNPIGSQLFVHVIGADAEARVEAEIVAEEKAEREAHERVAGVQPERSTSTVADVLRDIGGDVGGGMSEWDNWMRGN